MIDLHIHSNHSDGTDSVLEILEKANNKLSQISITDHNTYLGGLEAFQYQSKFPNMEIIIGSELSSTYYRKEAHVLGYFNSKDFKTEKLDKFIEETQKMKKEVLSAMINKINQKFHENFSYEEIAAKYPHTILNRVHLCHLLLDKGYISSIDEGFQKYLKRGRPCFVSRDYYPLKEVIHLIHESGGIAIKAHPVVDKPDGIYMRTYLSEAFDLGLDGVEVFHSRQNEIQSQELLSICKEFKKIPTGGSDYHGSIKKVPLGYGNVSDRYKISF